MYIVQSKQLNNSIDKCVECLRSCYTEINLILFKVISIYISTTSLVYCFSCIWLISRPIDSSACLHNCLFSWQPWFNQSYAIALRITWRALDCLNRSADAIFAFPTDRAAAAAAAAHSRAAHECQQINKSKPQIASFDKALRKKQKIY